MGQIERAASCCGARAGLAQEVDVRIERLKQVARYRSGD